LRISEQIKFDKLKFPTGFSDPVVVDIQNVADYAYDNTDSKDYASVVSPWPAAIFEWSTFKHGGENDIAVMFFQERAEKIWSYWAAAVLRYKGQLFEDFVFHGTIQEDGSPSEVEWAEGKDFKSLSSIDFITPEGVRTELPKNVDAGDIAAAYLNVVMLALSFANCHNVITQDIVPHQTRQQRRHSEPSISYKVLNIPGFSTQYKSAAQGYPTDSLSQRRLHLCRGHFAHHENMFGRLGPRTVWVPAHVKGSVDAGIILKEYRIST
jgi:hypothetical protein